MRYLMRAGRRHVADLGAAARAGTALGNLNGVFVLLVGTDCVSGTPSSTYTRRRQRECSQLQLFMQAPVSHLPVCLFSPVPRP